MSLEKGKQQLFTLFFRDAECDRSFSPFDKIGLNRAEN